MHILIILCLFIVYFPHKRSYIRLYTRQYYGVYLTYFRILVFFFLKCKIIAQQKRCYVKKKLGNNFENKTWYRVKTILIKCSWSKIPCGKELVKIAGLLIIQRNKWIVLQLRIIYDPMHFFFGKLGIIYISTQRCRN